MPTVARRSLCHNHLQQHAPTSAPVSDVVSPVISALWSTCVRDRTATHAYHFAAPATSVRHCPSRRDMTELLGPGVSVCALLLLICSVAAPLLTGATMRYSGKLQHDSSNSSPATDTCSKQLNMTLVRYSTPNYFEHGNSAGDHCGRCEFMRIVDEHS